MNYPPQEWDKNPHYFSSIYCAKLIYYKMVTEKNECDVTRQKEGCPAVYYIIHLYSIFLSSEHSDLAAPAQTASFTRMLQQLIQNNDSLACLITDL